MATMTVRTTVAFDPATAARLERLARRWGVSKSETLRRALEMVENDSLSSSKEVPDFGHMTALQIMDWLKENPQAPIPGGWGDDPNRELRELRERDAEIENERELTRSRPDTLPDLTLFLMMAVRRGVGGDVRV
jgi:hypothetical protein